MFTKSRFVLSFGWLIVLPLFKIAPVLVRLDHIASVIVNADQRVT